MAKPVVIALGTNLGARVGHMRAAVQFLQSISASPVRTSFLYETPPWGVVDQPPFLNAVAEIHTSLSPHDLLLELKKAEERLGRVYTRRWGPRQIDMDILLYGEEGRETLETESLTIPHISMQEREFVLRPLCEYVTSVPARHGLACLLPDCILAATLLDSSQAVLSTLHMRCLVSLASIAPDLVHPRLNKSMEALLSDVTPDPAIKRVVPVGQGMWYGLTGQYPSCRIARRHPSNTRSQDCRVRAASMQRSSAGPMRTGQC